MESPGTDQPQISGPPATAAGTVATDYQDRSTALIVFGIIEILGGALIALMIPLMLLGMIFARKSGGGVPPGNIAIALLTYLVLAVTLVTLGIGACMAKRWARALNLILSWLWVITGTLMTVALTVFTPSSFLAAMHTAAEQNPNSGNVSTGVAAVVLTFVIVLASLFLVFLPLGFLLFYRSKNVEETCRHRDPVEHWTDRRPLPVIAAALMFALSAMYCVGTSFSAPLFPLFGRYLTGSAAAGLLLAVAILDAYLAVSFLKLKLPAWWLAVMLLSLRLISSVVTFARTNLLDAYARLGWSEVQLRAMRANPVTTARSLPLWAAAFGLAYLGFILWVKRYFRPAAAPSYTGGGNSIPDIPQLGS